MELSDDGKKFTDEELREEVDTMMIAVVFFFVFISKIELIECKKRKF